MLPTTKNSINAIDANKVYDLLIKKDVSSLSKEEKSQYCIKLCESLGLNPLTQPFEFIRLGGREVPYAKKDATDQLRKVHNITVDSMDEKFVNGLCVVKVTVSHPCGRKDSSTGAVNINNLKGDALANAIMKAETKAKRRATLSICGLGFLDESEFHTIPELKKTRLESVDINYLEVFSKKFQERIYDDNNEASFYRKKYFIENLRPDKNIKDQNYWQNLCKKIDYILEDDVWKWVEDKRGC